MNKKKRNAKHVRKKEEYLNLFPDDKPSETERMRSRALKEAQDIRKFEIDLYWKRTGSCPRLKQKKIYRLSSPVNSASC